MNIKRIIVEEVGEFEWIKNISDEWEPNIGDKFICKPGFTRDYMSDKYGGAAYVEGRVYTIHDVSINYDNDDHTVLFTEEYPHHHGVYKKASEPYI
jgi:hypothetical protein